MYELKVESGKTPSLSTFCYDPTSIIIYTYIFF